MTPFDLIVHATHEAGVKVGGIGAVLAGLLGARAYNERISRTVLVGPMNTRDAAEMERLVAPRNRLQIDYSSYHALDRVAPALGDVLRRIEREYQVRLLYGQRAFGPQDEGPLLHEVLLVDGSHADADRINAYKGALYRRFGIQSDRYESHPEFSQHVNAAEPAYHALQAVARDAGPKRVIIAHEFMGLPLCYSAILRRAGSTEAQDGDRSAKYRTVFYGHEVATVRPIVESHPGHDTMFYNVLARAQMEGRYLADVFGDQSAFFKDALIRPAARHCDNLLAVGDSVVDEMRFLDADWDRANIDLVYNGVTSHEITLEAKKRSRNRLRQYCVNLLGYRPDYVFTHVTRFVPSKGLWRDLRLMEHLDDLLAEQGERAVLFALSTIIPVGRPAKAIFKMERKYGWPARHRKATVHVAGRDIPDLISHEVPFYRALDRFNRSSRAAKVVLVNQFGWSRDRCGLRMPQEMEFLDIRQGSDLEFGQSIYEPFGIAQVEPLCYGALCVLSSACGCLGFIRRAGGLGQANVIVADYIALEDGRAASIESALAIDQDKRDQIEAETARQVAQTIAERLPRDDAAAQELIESGFALSRRMSWEVVVTQYLLPGLERALGQGTK